MKLLFEFFPILLFFVTYKLYDIYIATATAIVAAIIQVIVGRYQQKRWVPVHLITLAIIVIFGGATLLLQDEVYIKWKPTVLNWLFALVFLGSQFVGKKTIAERMMGNQIQLPNNLWTRLNSGWIMFFIISGLSNLYVMRHFDTATWVNFKLFGLLGMTICFIIAQSIYISRHMTPEGNDDRKESL